MKNIKDLEIINELNINNLLNRLYNGETCKIRFENIYVEKIFKQLAAAQFNDKIKCFAIPNTNRGWLAYVKK